MEIFEEIPDEELWEDGEVTNAIRMMEKIYDRVFVGGDWYICRRVQ
tara:strand:+ start:179 stop:316 length:138 start_codon:yes stop_codon:yes gene_type:complete